MRNEINRGLGKVFKQYYKLRVDDVKGVIVNKNNITG